MMNGKVLVVFGTRPEAIKMAPIVKALSASTRLEVVTCVTAQHREMLDQVLHIFQIRPDYDLDLMVPGQGLTALTARILVHVGKVIERESPDLILVQGDTTTAMAVGLAAFYAKIPIGHVEAGLRTGDMRSPWPEEANRRLLSVLASIHFAPTQLAHENLVRDGVPKEHIFTVGNSVIDALMGVRARLANDRKLAIEMKNSFDYIDPTRRLILVTSHRRENLGGGLEAICRGLKRLSQRDDVQVIFSVHPNPEVQKTVESLLGAEEGVQLISPQSYVHFVYLLTRAFMVLSDSGGIQEEAPSLGKPVLVLRDTTERQEALVAGTALLVGTDENRIVLEAEKLLDSESAYADMAQRENPHGDGTASYKIVQILEDWSHALGNKANQMKLQSIQMQSKKRVDR